MIQKPTTFSSTMFRVPLISLLASTPVFSQLITTDLVYHWDSSDSATATATTWDSKAGSGASNTVWGITGNTLRVGSSAFPTITEAYQPNGTASSGATRTTFDAFSLADATFEVWIKPLDLTNNQVLFETGGGAIGSGIYLKNDGTVFYLVKNNAVDAIVESTTQLEEGSWYQVTATYDKNASGTNDRIAIAINGVEEDSDTTTTGLDDWAGGDGAGLGRINGDEGADGATNEPTPGIDTYSALNGQIGIFRFYGAALSEADVLQNFDATPVISSTPDSGTTDEETPITTLDGGRTNLFSNDSGASNGLVSADSSSVNGASVTVDPSGTFSYDPSGSSILNTLGAGESLVDTFTYTIEDATVPSEVTPGVTFELIADTSTDSFGWGGKGTPVAASGLAKPSSITRAYEFDGTTGANRVDFQTGAYDVNDASFEFWIRPDVVDARQTLFETGGSGTGSGVFLNDDGTVSFLSKLGSNPFVKSTSILTAGAWHHIVVTYDLGATSTFSLYINGRFEGSANSTDTDDWSGIDDAGLARVTGTSAGDFVDIDDVPGNQPYGFFDGQIGLMRFYTGKVLSASEVAANLAAANATATVSITVNGVNDAPVVAPETADSSQGLAVTLDLLANETDVDTNDVLIVSDIDESGNGGVPPLTFTSTEGAMVTITEDGTFTYDPSSSTSILGLAPGATLTETFTYDVSDGIETLQTTVAVTSTGVGNATDDYAATDAATLVNVDVLGNDWVRDGTSLATPTSGAEFALVADDNSAGTNTSTEWFNVGNSLQASIPDPAGAVGSTLVTGLTSPPGLTATYDFDSGAATPGIAMDGVDDPDYGASDLADASIEMVFRPSDQIGDEVIWEVGGLTDGSSLTLSGNQLIWTSGDNGNQAMQAVGTLPSNALAGGEFVHVIVQISLTDDFVQMYINGSLADTGVAVDVRDGKPGDLADWCGADPGALGTALPAVSIGGNVANLGNFGTIDLDGFGSYDGEIALLRTYESLLTPSEIFANFEAIYGTSVPADVTDIIDIAGDSTPTVGESVTLPSGSTVTLKADDTFDYNPNPDFSFILANGEVFRDSFTYTLASIPETIVTVNVDVTGLTGVVPTTVYVDDDFSGGIYSAIPDADGGSPVASANLGYNAFTTIGDAIAGVDPAGTIVLNDGDYSAETVDLINLLPLGTIRLTDTTGGVSVGAINTATTNSVDLQTNTLTAASGILKCDVSGTGGVTKATSGILIYHAPVTYTGTTSVTDGTLRIGTDSAGLLSELSGDGPVLVSGDGILELNPADVLQTITQTGEISGDGTVSSIGNGTVIFNGTGNPSFTGTFVLGEEVTTSFDGTSGTQEGTVVVNHNDDLGSGILLSSGAQLQAGTPGLTIPLNVEITNGGFRVGGSNDITFSGNFTNLGAARAYGNYGLDGRTFTITGNIDLNGGDLVVEGSNDKDNGTWIFSGNISGSNDVVLDIEFDDGIAIFSGTNTYTGVTTLSEGTMVTATGFSHTGGGTYTVTANTVLEGTGTTDAAVTINPGGTLRPGGDGIATLGTGDLDIAGTLEIDVDNTAGVAGTAYDQVVVTGSVTISGALSVIDGVTVEPSPATIVVLDNDDVDAISGAFSSGDPFSDFMGSGLSGTADLLGGDGNDLALITQSALESWRVANGLAPDGSEDDLDQDMDGLVNLLEFGFGTDVGTSDNGTLNPDGSVNGTPTLQHSGGGGGVTFDAIFNRRDDAGQPGSVEYTVQFSSDLTTFYDSTAPVTIVTDSTADPDYHVASVPYPAILPDGKKARFFRVKVDPTP